MHEVERTHEAYRRAVSDAAATQRWEHVADFYTSSAVLRRTGTLELRGRESIRAMLLETIGSFPGTLVAQVAVVRHSVDTTRGQVVHEVRYRTCDPGDGSVHAASTMSTLAYAGGGLWASCDVVHAPTAFTAMWRSWARAADRCGHVEAGRVLDHLEELQPAL